MLARGMFTFQKALKCVFEAYCRKKTLYKAAGVWKNSTYLGCSNLKLSSHKIYHNVSVFTMPKTKNVKSDQLKLAKSIPIKKTEPKRKKQKRKRSKKKNKHSKKKSVVSQCIVTETAASPSSDNDIRVVFDSKAEQETITIDSGDSEDSDNMGNVNSENAGSFSTSGGMQNVQGSWHCNSMGWTYDSGYVVGTEPPTNAEFCVRDGNSVISTSVQEENGTPSMPSQLLTDSPERVKLKSMRTWKYTKFGSNMKSTMKSSQNLVFTLLSYNVLAQDLLHSHTYLYRKHKREALRWDLRSQLLLKEIKEANADIMCLQEVQASHLYTFYRQLDELGYSSIYKQRTGDNVDGVAIYYKRSLFELVHHTSVEYYQPAVDILNRHNVGLIAKLSVKGSNNQQIVVATTHLLFNPRRHDVKLAQIQMLLTEVERFAFQSLRFGTAVYWPVIITGDMNFEPHTGVYKFLTEGMFRYEGVCGHTLSEFPQGRSLGKELLPKRLDILDTCQHWGLLCKRLIEELNHVTELKLLRIYNTDHQRLKREMNITNEVPRSFEDLVESAKCEGLVNNFVPFFRPNSVPPMPDAGFATGQLTHNLNLRSVYSHTEQDQQKKQATTNQGKWVTVDYIFYSCRRNLQTGNLRLVGKYKLPTVAEAASMGRIPNLASPSDHYPLLAAFFLQL